MGTTEANVDLDCSGVGVTEAIDDPVIGMLVTLARAARRQGAQVALVRALRPTRIRRRRRLLRTESLKTHPNVGATTNTSVPAKWDTPHAIFGDRS